jgi:hypothetical protein
MHYVGHYTISFQNARSLHHKKRLRGFAELYVITSEKIIKFNHDISAAQVTYIPRKNKYE